MSAVRKEPCSSCPYRRDVPSGVWSAHEYEKLRDYDLPTGEQPLATFACHATPDFHCHGWAVVHSNRGHQFELLALRFEAMTRMAPVAVPEPFVPLFSSGNEAADRGERDVEEPSLEAMGVVDRLLHKYNRLRLQ